MQIRIEGSDLPGLHCGPSPDSPGGYHNVHVGIQRRKKLWLDAIPPGVLDRALVARTLVGRLGLTDGSGMPLCAAVRPPLVEWSAGT